MNILDRIVTTKREEVGRLREWAGAVESGLDAAPPVRDLAAALAGAGTVSVMAEVKRRSPGAGEIRAGLNPPGLARAYEENGAAAISVLTDGEYFGGSLDDLRDVRNRVEVPVLRKDFVIDPLQVAEARGAGADAVLLIVRILDDPMLGTLLERTRELGMTALVEVHDEGELDRALAAGARVVGINNRDLDTFETRLEVTLGLAERVPSDVVLVSESGIRGPEDVARVGSGGADAVLVGESLLRAADPGSAVAELAGIERVSRGDV